MPYGHNGTVFMAHFVMSPSSTLMVIHTFPLFRISWLFTRVIEVKFIPSSVHTELRWWTSHLQIPNFYRELKPRGPLQDLDIFVDASTDWGISIKIGELWAAFRLWPNWKIPGRDICWLETVAIELLA